MDFVQNLVVKQHHPHDAPSSSTSTPTSYASARTEAILSLLMCCDRGGKQLIAAFPALGPRKGGSGPDLREGALRAVREISSHELRRVLMEVEARLCMADQVTASFPLREKLVSFFTLYPRSTTAHLLCLAPSNNMALPPN
jgi:hypothetical protein